MYDDHALMIFLSNFLFLPISTFLTCFRVGLVCRLKPTRFVVTCFWVKAWFFHLLKNATFRALKRSSKKLVTTLLSASSARLEGWSFYIVVSRLDCRSSTELEASDDVDRSRLRLFWSSRNRIRAFRVESDESESSF